MHNSAAVRSCCLLTADGGAARVGPPRPRERLEGLCRVHGLYPGTAGVCPSRNRCLEQRARRRKRRWAHLLENEAPVHDTKESAPEHKRAR